MKTLLFITTLLLCTTTAGIAQTHKNQPIKPEMLANTVMVRLKSGYTITEAKQALATSGARPVRQMLLPEQSVRFNLHQSAPNSNSKLGEILKAEEPILRTFVVEYDGNTSPERFCTKLMKTNPAIEIAEPYYIAKPLGKPNDEFVNQQQLLNVIKAFEAWDITQGDPSVVIGICDNGIDQTHEDLMSSIAPNNNETPNNGIDDDQNGYVDDYIGVNLGSKDDASKPGNTAVSDPHGTSVAGIAGATTNNSKGMAGVGYKCKIFPIKAGRVGSQNVYYGNEGLIYAALRGFKVINCSWGIPFGYSRIQESIVKYVQSQGVVIVAAAGNSSNTIPYYPAAYPGVLGVGQVTINDVVGGEAVGSHVAITAPGENSVATTNSEQKYTFNFSGSSAAAPVVSGVVGIVRSLHPELTARQAAELTRLSTDNIDAQNPSVAGIIPGRVNMLKAVTLNPLSTPSIRPEKITYHIRDREVTRFSLGDTVTASIRGFNYLGAATNVICSLSNNDFINPFQFVDSTGTIITVASGAGVEFPSFTFVVTKQSTELKFIRVSMKASNYDDFFLLPIIPTSDMALFENDSLRFSIGDNGMFGYSGNSVDWDGVGLDYKNGGNVIFSISFNTLPNHCLILTEDESKVESAIVPSSDFTSEKNFITPRPNVSVINDNDNDEANRIGVKIEREVAMAPNLPAAKIRFTITNTSGKALKNISLGYYLDWDIGDYGSYNYARTLNEAIPQGLNAAAEVITRDGEVNVGNQNKQYPFAGWIVSTNDPTARPQMAAVNVDDFIIGDFNNDEMIQLMNSDTMLQAKEKTDIGMAAGMKFPGDFLPNATRTFELCIGAAMSRAELAATLKSCLLVNSIENEHIANTTQGWTISPNPANDEIIISGNENSPSRITLYTVVGEIITEVQSDGNLARISTTQLQAGLYILHIQTGSKYSQLPVIIVH